MQTVNIANETKAISEAITSELRYRWLTQVKTSAEFLGNVHVDAQANLWFEFRVKGVVYNNEIDQDYEAILRIDTNGDGDILEDGLAEKLALEGCIVWANRDSAEFLHIATAKFLAARS